MDIMFSSITSHIIIIIVAFSTFSNLSIAQDHECVRECISGEPAKRCVYNFTLEWYYSMSKACYACPDVPEDCFRQDCVPTNGYHRSIVTVNRQIPGPAIEVCLGDEIVVHVENEMLTEATTIHWHGLHQRATPYMDGVPFVTQCNIQPGTSFTYEFTATEVGTHFYHSHSGLQRSDGLFGALIVHQPKNEDPHGDLYDYDLSEHVIVLIDWEHTMTAVQKFLQVYHGVEELGAAGVLVNGRGRNHNADPPIEIPYPRFIVEKGYRYRFRVIEAGTIECPVVISIDDHPLTVIGTDGNDIVAVEAESIVLYPGERFDFVIDANQEEDGLFWIKFKGISTCDLNEVFQLAVLQYANASDTDYPENAPSYDNITTEGVQINAYNVGMEGTNTTLSIPELSYLGERDNVTLKETPDFKYLLSFNMYALDNPMFHRAGLYGYYEVLTGFIKMTPLLNHISLKFLTKPLLPERFSISDELFCNETTVDMSVCEVEYCGCPFVVQLEIGQVVEIILVDKAMFNTTAHPMHLHGHNFRVIGMGRLQGEITDELITEMDEGGLLYRNLDNPPIKDTVIIPGTGYTIIRFIASNPGYWFMHCHLEYHAEVGMGLIFKIGQNEDMVEVPENFPTCGNYEPVARTSNATDYKMSNLHLYISILFLIYNKIYG